MSPPLFSVLVPTYNQAAYLPRALESLQEQTCADWQAVVVNDGSTDSTRAILEDFAAADTRICCFEQPNGGVAAALNTALGHARGAWILWLSSDDWFLPEKLSVHERTCRERPDIAVFHSDYWLFDEANRQLLPAAIDFRQFLPQKRDQVIKFFESNCFNGISICIRREAFDGVGPFKPYLRNGQDFDMWLRLSARFEHGFVEQRTCVTRVHAGAGSVTSAATGLLDSGWALLEYLNQHRFAALFPFSDLSEREQLIAALGAVFKVLVNPGAYVNLSGYGVPLVERLREWLAEECPRRLLGTARSLVRTVGSSLLTAAVSPALGRSLVELGQQLGRPFGYQPYAHFTLLQVRVDELEQQATESAQKTAAVIRQYMQHHPCRATESVDARA